MDQPLSKLQTKEDERAELRIGGGLLHALGMGVITGAADDDPSAIGTYADAGTKFGLAFHFRSTGPTSRFDPPLASIGIRMCSYTRFPSAGSRSAAANKFLFRASSIAHPCEGPSVAEVINKPVDRGSKSRSRDRDRFPTESRCLAPGARPGNNGGPELEPAMKRIGRPPPP